MTYDIIATGSKGNAVILGDKILIDCGVPYKAIEPYIKGLKLVLLTHIHTDHFKQSTIKKLADMRPTLRFGCCDWLIAPLLDCGVSQYQIDNYMPGYDYHYPFANFHVETFLLSHNVDNCGYKVMIDGKKVLYATDTCKIETDAPGYDLYMIEGNYDEDELAQRIAQKEADGTGYIYERHVAKNHLSRASASEWLLKNIGPNSECIFMHVHEDREL